MKIYTILLMSIIPVFLTAQTTMEEYNYLTEDYPNQISKSEIPKKSGYYFQDLMNMVDNSGKIRLLYKENQASVIPTATLIHVSGESKMYYISVPHEDSDRIVFDQYADDLQELFKESELARNNYSRIMFRYPKQLQKYYDEIMALEGEFLTPEKVSTGSLAPSKPKKPQPKMALPATQKGGAIEENEEVKTATKLKSKEKIIIKSTVTQTRTAARKKGESRAKVHSVLTHRKILGKPAIINETNKFGVIRIDICVNQKGEIVSVRYNKKSSDTKNEELVEIAKTLAKQYLFSKSHLSRQCGHIIFKFQ
ncbi:MAG: hypothetical protein ACI97N_000284 [Cognaticolwellia sp.]|jgi:hypothetical protein